MESLADILEQELEEAVEVKNKRSLHRYITLLTENLVRQDRNEREHSEFREAIIRIDTRIEEGFKRMDERFEAIQRSMDERFGAVQKSMDERFTSVDKRFDMMFKFMTTGFVILATMMSVYQFLA
ncbi:hypothetical protein B4O97_04055 [Marispirochaeta aestuarii]|uniref:t-SNARE coiled-coil homology domain-containing protein n=1 Tax=Marispirochaeta aestuarii TaxID=1963862 RepID=A0A1Y1S1R7_9SPIO|nr:hypothetical protein [Marispirochaeta aestuarii]ORC37373.1 hypothetical protein B4O97_04055 [Marispirochaeta aestuarii]